MCSEFQNATEEDQYFRHHEDGRTRTVTQIKTIFQKCQRLKVGTSTETYGSKVILKTVLTDFIVIILHSLDLGHCILPKSFKMDAF